MTGGKLGSTALYPACPGAIPGLQVEAGSYLVRFARTPDDLDRVLRLRYEIFNLELGEGRDEDELDARFQHPLIQRRDSLAVVGTYRMQTAEMARQGGGFYADPEFDLSTLPDPVRDATVEIDRACVAKDHRSGRVLHLLWRGLAAYLEWNRKHYFFGCCSLTNQDPAMGVAVHRHLEASGFVHPTLEVAPRPGGRCELPPGHPLPGRRCSSLAPPRRQSARSPGHRPSVQDHRLASYP